MERLTLSLISHTNVGKTTLARTLLRRDIGTVLDQAHVTDANEAHTLVETDEAELRLWDTPGLGDSVRLARRLRGREQPILWMLRQAWDRIADRPLWCSQQAVANIQEEADVVLYLVNASEEPQHAGYVAPEMEVLTWIGRPTLVLLNQAGDVSFKPEAAAAQLAAWRRCLESWSVVREVLFLDAFSRCWVQESGLLEHVARVLPEARRPVMEALKQAWEKRALGVFEESLSAITMHLVRTASDGEDLAGPRPRGAAKRRAMRALGERTRVSSERLIEMLLELYGLQGTPAAKVERAVSAFVLKGAQFLNPEQGALLGGVASGALGGLAADLMAGGLSFGGGLVAGVILGALGGAGLARGVQIVKGRSQPRMTWSAEALDRAVAQALLLYLAVAHFGRGRGDFESNEEPAVWRSTVADVLARNAESWARAWKYISPGTLPLEQARKDLLPLVTAAAREVLVAGYPEARPLLAGQVSKV